MTRTIALVVIALAFGLLPFLATGTSQMSTASAAMPTELAEHAMQSLAAWPATPR